MHNLNGRKNIQIFHKNSNSFKQYTATMSGIRFVEEKWGEGGSHKMQLQYPLMTKKGHILQEPCSNTCIC